jgi:hypothetical protein
LRPKPVQAQQDRSIKSGLDMGYLFGWDGLYPGKAKATTGTKRKPVAFSPLECAPSPVSRIALRALLEAMAGETTGR